MKQNSFRRQFGVKMWQIWRNPRTFGPLRIQTKSAPSPCQFLAAVPLLRKITMTQSLCSSLQTSWNLCYSWLVSSSTANMTADSRVLPSGSTPYVGQVIAIRLHRAWSSFVCEIHVVRVGRTPIVKQLNYTCHNLFIMRLKRICRHKSYYTVNFWQKSAAVGRLLQGCVCGQFPFMNIRLVRRNNLHCHWESALFFQ